MKIYRCPDHFLKLIEIRKNWYKCPNYYCGWTYRPPENRIEYDRQIKETKEYEKCRKIKTMVVLYLKKLNGKTTEQISEDMYYPKYKVQYIIRKIKRMIDKGMDINNFKIGV